ncbi:MAG: hypothetical protein V1891_00640 [bacterium]
MSYADSKNIGKISFIKENFIITKNLKTAELYEIVQIGHKKIIGEIIEIAPDETHIQTYENTTELSINDPIYSTNHYFLSKLGPGAFNYTEKNQNLMGKWNFLPMMFKGGEVNHGDILGEVKETASVSHKIITPYKLNGKIISIRSGNFTIQEPIIQIQDKNKLIDIFMRQTWPMRMPRPYQEKISSEPELISKQKILDSIFCSKFNQQEDKIEKSIMQKQLAKWTGADIIIAVMRKKNLPAFLNKFTEFKDLKSEQSLLEKTFFFINGSGLPSSRDIFMDKTIVAAEYFRDMGYNVLLIIDELSGWRKDLEELAHSCDNKSSYYSLRLKNFFARAGRVKCAGKPYREGSVAIIGGEE